jgi:hypothetical protein
VAIRPFAAGRIFEESRTSPADALTYVFGYPQVVTAVVSASSREHLDALVPFLASPGAA